MTRSLFTKKYGKRPDKINSKIKENIYSQKEFIKHIENERERANRNRHELSLLVFNFSPFNINPTVTSFVINQIRSLIRSIDEIGWYDQKRFGITLPYTNLQGAKDLSRRISKSLNFIASDIICEVYTYPSEKNRQRLNE